MNLAARGLAVSAMSLPPASLVFVLDRDAVSARRRFDEIGRELPAEVVKSARHTLGVESIVLANGTVIRFASIASLDRLRGYSVHLFAITDDARREAHGRNLDLASHIGPCLAVTGGEVASL